MRSVAIVYVSMFGQTQKIAKRLKARLEQAGIKACLMNAEDSQSEEFPNDIDSVIIGGGIYFDRYPSSLLEWIPRHKEFMDSKPLAFFNVSLAAAHNTEESQKSEELIGQFLTKTGLSPQYVASFAGALNYTEYSFFVRWYMKHFSRKAGLNLETYRDFEYTDWKNVHEFLDAFIRNDRSSAYSIHRHLHLGRPASRSAPVNPLEFQQR